MNNSKMTPRGQKRSQQISGLKYETSNDRLTDFTAENESDTNIKYTSTPLKKVAINRVRRQASAPPNFESEESTDAVKYKTRHLKRRKSSRDIRKERNSSVKAIPSSGDRREKRQRKFKKTRRGSGGNKNNPEVEEEEDDGNAASERFRKDKNQRKQDTAELPIAELLRNAQENQKSLQTRYEDPVPLPELTTDTVYVQGRNGFSAVKIGNFRSEKSHSEKLLKPIHVAIRIHSVSKTVMFFCQGLLGGIALSQEPKIYADSNPALGEMNATNHQHLISAIFLFLVTISLLAAMDRIDLGHFDLEHLREIFSHHCMTILTFPLYLVAICIHLSTMINEQSRTSVGQGSNVTDGDAAFDNEENSRNRQSNTWKFIFCIIAWFCVSFGPDDDMTTSHLEAMQNYAK